MTATIPDLLHARAGEAPDAPGFFHVADGQWASWTWERYRERAALAGSGLRAAGIGRGDHVMLLVAEVDVAVSVLFGAWAVGAVPILVGLPSRLTDATAFVADLRRTAQRLHAATLVVSDMVTAFVGASHEPPRVLAAGSLLDGEPPDRGVWEQVDPSAPAVIQLTSGSTGQPRGVVLSHAAVLAHLAAISAALPAGEDAREVTWLPLHHDMGVIGGLV